MSALDDPLESIDLIDSLLPSQSPFNPFDDALTGVLISQTMAAPIDTTTNTVEAETSTVAPTTVATTTPATSVVPTTTATSAVVTTPSTSPVVASSSAAPSSSSTTVVASSASPSLSSSTTTTASSAAATTSSAVPTTSSAAPSSTSTSSSTTEQTTQIVTVTQSQVSAPGLVTSFSSISRSSSASKAASTGSDKGGVGGSGLPVGGLVGIVIGGLAVLVVIGFSITRSMRKRNRAKRTANRSSLFEPWPAPVAMEDEPYEKPTYDAGPAQSYPLQNATGNLYDDSAYPAYDTQGQYDQYNDYPAQPYNSYPPQPYPENAAGIGAAAAAGAAGLGAVGAGVGGAAAAANGIHDGMMVRVKVAFVRSLEDELAITPGQQLYLHTAYDDGWTLCEDQAQNRGVVPFSCLEPWEESAAQNYAPETAEQALDTSATGRRRSSLYAPQ